MEENTSSSIDIDGIKAKAIAVVTKPVEFFKSMPQEGGYKEPMTFLAATGLVTGIVTAILSLGGPVGTALASVVLFPLLFPIMAFVGAAILFVLWKILGSQKPFETSYRCLAYVTALSPIMAVINLVPYAGGVAATAWVCYMYFIASVEVHGIEKKKAQLAWVIIFIVFALLGISSERAARQFEARWGDDAEDAEAAAEAAGTAIGNFFKGVDKAVEEENRGN